MKRISQKNIPTYPPILWTIVIYLLYDNLIHKFDISPIWQGVGLTTGIIFLALLWITYFHFLFTADLVDIFDEREALGRTMFDGALKRVVKK